MPAEFWKGEDISLQRLLSDEVKSSSAEPFVHKDGISAKKWRFWTSFHVILIGLYSAIYFGFLLYHTQSPAAAKTDFLQLPAREALQPQLRFFPTRLEHNAFAGAPRPELEEAWHSLLQNDNIRVPRVVLDQLHLSSVYTRDGLDGIASLSVYHSIHCLKLVRRMMYKEHYHANTSGTAMERQMKHADHCIEYLRESLMCKPDISLVTFRWINDTAQHPDEPSVYYPTNLDSSQHECMEWESLNDWAGKRVFNLYDVDLLDRPEP